MGSAGWGEDDSAVGQNESDDEEDLTPIREVRLPGKLYAEVLAQFPPHPLPPKSFHAKDDSPRSGGIYKFLKL